ncbi:SDR family oxidoreductase [Mycobacterium sp. AZCC_0083]|uniref:SDR family NAD(P)-dependent oxidoreductase n=1 Tax=Mycobacterium sp. AZCC_0083 TaxID=2735882 RepID=UPI0017DDC576|nr:SDR family oxidoreductase [Mycobacterium sp. AZCC_0083]MBB5167599.1 NAD(P)-dependent dehydrogenase (short-subunit alcohol dehydrogenase family) [Mycobacterium sp. AZCC_0083]
MAVVTGAGSGIGRETAITLARAGAAVVVSDVSEHAGQESVDIIGDTACFITTDVTDRASVQHLIDETLRRYGKLDVAHNNAGISGDVGRTADLNAEDWGRVIAVNLTGVFNCLQAELRVLVPQKSGSVINTASVLGLGAIPEQAHYIAAKHGVIGLTKAAAIDYATSGVRINAVAPAPVRTTLVERLDAENPGYIERLSSYIPAGRIALPAEIAQAVLYLASDASEFVNGTVLRVDGALAAL